MLLLLLSCGGSERRPNLLLVTIDTIRADHLGCYGYFRNTSPNLDAFAAESMVFDDCFAPVATTLPSHLSLLTAAYPMEHGVLANTGSAHRRFVPNPALRTYAEIAGEAGYRTAAFVSAAPLKRHTGIDAGFDLFDEPAGAERRAEETNEAVSAWLETMDGRPWFAWVHYFDPHVTYAPPPPWDSYYSMDDDLVRHLSERRFLSGKVQHGSEEIRTADLVNLYDGEVAYTDSQIGKLLSAFRAAGGYEETVIIVVGDHGESLGQHDVWHHGDVWNEQLRVPLLIRLPGRHPERVGKALSVTDILPTLLSLESRLPAGPIGTQGGGESAFARNVAFLPGQSSTRTSAERSRPEFFSLTGERWKLIHRPAGAERGSMLFDRKSDPHELNDLASAMADTVSALNQILAKSFMNQRERRVEMLGGEGGAVTDPTELDPEVQRELRSLGYID